MVVRATTTTRTTPPQTEDTNTREIRAHCRRDLLQERLNVVKGVIEYRSNKTIKNHRTKSTKQGSSRDADPDVEFEYPGIRTIDRVSGKQGKIN